MGATLSILGLYQYDQTILDPLTKVTPDIVDKEALKSEILSQCAEQEILYPDPDIFKSMLGYWATGYKIIWNRIAKAIETEYNIAENYDRTEEWTDTGNNTSTAENYQKGYNETELVNTDKTTGTGNGTSTHKGRVHGNIGVRSAQELVTQELDLAERLNLTQRIVDDFKHRFVLPVY